MLKRKYFLSSKLQNVVNLKKKNKLIFFKLAPNFIHKAECVFYDLNSYQRMLVHTLAKFFNLSSSSKSSKRSCEEDDENDEDESEKYKDLYLSKNNEKIKFPILKLKNYLTKLQLDLHYDQKEEELKSKEKVFLII